MNQKKRMPLAAVAVASALMFGCASSSNDSLNETIATGSTAVNEQAQASEDTTASQDTANNGANDSNVSASNQIGRRQNMVALVQSNSNLSTLLQLIRAADMVTVLESPGNYTLLAPTNEAFAALPAGTLEVLQQPGNKLELTRILQAHVLPRQVRSGEFGDNMRLQTAQGDEVTVETNGAGIVIGGARLITSDVEASNGVVHVIDKVLVPPKE